MSIEIGKRIREAIEDSDMSQAEIARALKVSPQALSSSLKTGTMEKERMLQFCELVGVDYEWLITGSERQIRPKGTAARGRRLGVAEVDEKYVYVPKYAAIGGLGVGRHNEQHVEVSGTYAFRRDFILKNGWRLEALAVFEAEGHSMAPTINDGDVVLANTDDIDIASGQVYAIEDADKGTRIKRLFRQIDGRIRVVSDNPDKRLHPDDYLTPDTGARIIGRIVHRSGSV